MFLDCSDPVHAVGRPCYLLAAHQCGHVFRARASTLPNHTKERDAITKFDLTESMTARIRSGTSPAATVLGLLLWGRGRILKPVTVGRDLKALAAVVLDVLADPAQHLHIDGSGMLQAPGSGPTRLQLGSRFSIQMRQWGLPYRVENSVTEYEEDRHIAWRPWVRVAGRRIAGE
jgi:hypothetical protein